MVLRDGRTLELPIPEGDEAKLALAKSLIPASAPVVCTVVPGTSSEGAGFEQWYLVVAV